MDFQLIGLNPTFRVKIVRIDSIFLFASSLRMRTPEIDTPAIRLTSATEEGGPEES